MLTREQIVGRGKGSPKLVHIPEWGGDILAAPITIKQILSLGSLDGGGDSARLVAEIVAEIVVDESGASILSLEDVHAMDPKIVVAAFTSISKAHRDDPDDLAKNS